eukprot:TRINITY_DN76869_c0_g1_i1.p1 TRINITY_DN76869_c0_g1~~TRINITY_DN76869_c0_g1_i1.p1  ORF type:complete len:290 (-),score=14.04 TRINITY_DN76869_c0_g1_i1:138-944(-)
MGHRIAAAFGIIEIEVINLGVLSLGSRDRRYFIGVFDQWLEVPSPSWVEFGWSESRDVDLILCAFVVVYLLWKLAPIRARLHCLASWSNIRSFRIWTLFTALFSHEAADHLLTNALFLYSTAPPVRVMLGRMQFFCLYIGGGSCACLASLCLSPLLRRVHTVECIGASSSLYALLGFLASNCAEVRWLGREWQWAQFAVIHIVMDWCRGVDVAAHVVGASIGWGAGKYGLLNAQVEWEAAQAQKSHAGAGLGTGEHLQYWSDRWVSSG